MKIRYALPLLSAAMTVSAVAQAATGYTTERLNLRAGPGRDYPTIVSIGRNAKVTVHGCLNRYDWCDVSKGRTRGWVDGSSLAIPYQGRRVGVVEYGPRVRVPVLTFSFDNYWDNHYRRAAFYHDRDNWRERWRNWTRDQDHDGVPNRLDRDRDGDGVPNRVDRDRDGDGVRNNRDNAPNNPSRR